MGIIGHLTKLLSGKSKYQALANNTKLETIGYYAPDFSGSALPQADITFMSAVNTHARHSSKIELKATFNGEPSKAKRYLTRLLSYQPNPIQDAPTFWKNVATSYFRDNLAILYLDFDYLNVREPLKAIWLLDTTESLPTVKQYQDKTFLEFKLQTETRLASLDELIILARDADPSSLFGSRSAAVRATLQTISTMNQGLEIAIKQSAYIRFIITSNTPLRDDVKDRKLEEFKKYLDAANNNGAIINDGATQVQPIESKASYGSVEHMDAAKDDILKYLGISEKIIQGTYSEDEWQGYYEGTLEPLYNEIAVALTNRIYTSAQIQLGHAIEVSSSKLHSASEKTKLAKAGMYMKLPVYKPNEVCRLLGLPELESGEEEFSNLNYVKTSEQSKYQVGTEGAQPEEVDNNAN